MPIEFTLSGDFRNNMGSITQGLTDKDTVGLIFNEMKPTKSFFAVPRDKYISLLYKSHNPDEADEIKSLLEKLDADVINKYKAMIRKRYEKKI